jgi:hypothetical protein
VFIILVVWLQNSNDMFVFGVGISFVFVVVAAVVFFLTLGRLFREVFFFALLLGVKL